MVKIWGGGGFLLSQEETKESLERIKGRIGLDG